MTMTSNQPPPLYTRRGRLGVLLRRLAGVQESTMDVVPGERARYTSMGGVVLGTAAIATVSMGVALHAVFGTWTNPLMIAFTLLWGLFILNLDRWLMSSVIDRDGLARIVRFLPRIILAIIFGVIIAEPLLLGVFGSAIERDVRDERNAVVQQFRTDLETCNSASAPYPPAKSCVVNGYIIDVGPSPSEVQLTQTVAQAHTLRVRVDRDTAQVNVKTDNAHKECDGASGPGFTGRRGLGKRCTKRYAELAAYKRDNRVSENVLELQRLEAKMAELREKMAAERLNHDEIVDREINVRVAERLGSAQIGLLERLRAMRRLVSENGYVHATQWALRIFFIVVDSLPVLVKLLSGRTAYDRVSTDRLAREERAQQLAIGTLSYRDAVEAGVHRYRIDLEGAALRGRASTDAWRANRHTEDELRHLIDENTDQIMGRTE
jgi:Domain of unknown function (DUF4407)